MRGVWCWFCAEYFPPTVGLPRGWARRVVRLGQNVTRLSQRTNTASFCIARSASQRAQSLERLTALPINKKGARATQPLEKSCAANSCDPNWEYSASLSSLIYVNILLRKYPEWNWPNPRRHSGVSIVAEQEYTRKPWNSSVKHPMLRLSQNVTT